MKVLAVHFTAESNEHVKNLNVFENFVYKVGNEMLNDMYIKDIFNQAGIEMIPTIYANGHSGGVVCPIAFQFILSEICKAVKHYTDTGEIDGIFMFLHGASKVKDLEGGSGEHKILKEVRKIVGKYMPIAVVMDPHGNLSQEFIDNTNIVRCFRESPHTDRIEAHRIVARKFIYLLQHRSNVHPAYRQIPLMLGGERSVSTDEPMVSINRLLDEIEADDKILTASYHVGYLRHDTDRCGASAVVVPKSEEFIDYAEEMAEKIAQYAFSKRHEFHYHGNAATPTEALKQALEFQGRPVFLTDSGDNTTSGGSGFNTLVLRQLLTLDDFKGKRVLLAAITDPISVNHLREKTIGEQVSFSLGMNENVFSEPVRLEAIVAQKGCVHNMHYETKNLGDAITISIQGKPIDVIVSNRSITYCEKHQFDAANVSIDDYDIIVVKQGYLFPDLKDMTSFYIISLTEGATNQRTETVTYKKIKRPMFPIDNI